MRRGRGEEEEVEEERRRLQEEVRRVVSRYDTTHETTLPPLDEEREKGAVDGETNCKERVAEAAAAGSQKPELSSRAVNQPPLPALGVVKERQRRGVAAVVAAPLPSSPAPLSPPATAAARPAPLPPRPQRKTPKLRHLLF